MAIEQETSDYQKKKYIPKGLVASYMHRISEADPFVREIQDEPSALRLYMDTCTKCGVCAQECPVYYGQPDKRMHPVERSKQVIRLYKKYATRWGRFWSALIPTQDFEEDDPELFAERMYECLTCRRCASFCPVGIDHSVISRVGRSLVDLMGLTPPALAKGTENSMVKGNLEGASSEAMLDSIQFLEEELQEETGLEIPIPVDQDCAEVFFLPPSGDVLVYAENLMGMAKVFYAAGVNWTMSSRAFDGSNFGFTTGNNFSMKWENKHYIDETEKLGCKLMVMGECGHAYRVMKFMASEGRWWGELPFEITSVFEYTAQLIRDGKIQLDPSRNPDSVTYHDSCQFAAGCGIIHEPREILKAACADFIEMPDGGYTQWCCGGGGGLSALRSVREFRMHISGKKKVEQMRETRAKVVSTSCLQCRTQLKELARYHKIDVTITGVHELVNNAIVLEQDRRGSQTPTP
ncbi:MAG: (Fe-S)-binding protein [bacterium]|nr:(Fe-S)-binding protein [bacterium]